MEENLKQLLLKDLCARLPYKVVIEYNNDGCSSTRELGLGSLHDFMFDNAECKPYLRPMSSMTKEEKQMMDSLWKDNNKLVFADPDEVRRYRFYDISVVDFLNSRHFDYRGLIEKGLALEAPKDMYNVK